MPEYRVHWCQCPTAYNPSRVLFVEASTPDDARVLATDHIQRRYGITWFVLGRDARDRNGIEEVQPLPAGIVKE